MTTHEREQRHQEQAGVPAPPPPLPRMVTVAQAAESLGLAEVTVYRYAADGTIPSVRIGRAIRIDIDAAVEQLRVRPRPSAAAAARTAAATRRPPSAREPQGTFARRARGLPERERSTPGPA